VVPLAEVRPTAAIPDATRPEARARRVREESAKGLILARSATAGLALASVAFLLNISVLGRMVHWSAQTREYAQFRKEVAFGTAPVGPLDRSGRLLHSGSPVALLEVPVLHLHEVVGEGTSSDVLMSGPGHLRSTVLPGQAGTSVILGRAAAYGGPFGNLGHVPVGSRITTTTGAGTVTFKVIDVREAGSALPPRSCPVRPG